MIAMQGRVDELAKELSGAEFGDIRLSKRQVKVGARLAEAPSKSFPTVFTEAELEGAYRFFGNEAVTPAAILAPHVGATLARMAGESVVLAIHDTTTMSFRPDGQREGLGRLRSSDQSFFAHFTLAVSGDGTRRPLGVLNLSAHVRAPTRTGNEHDRWGEQITRVAALELDSHSVVHVMDREADDYGLFAQLQLQEHRFIIRLAHNRLLDADDREGTAKLDQALARIQGVETREVLLSPRPAAKRSPAQKRIHPTRAGRVAKLAFGAVPVTLRRPTPQPHSLPASLAINVVRVWELDVPEGEAPVEWILLTSEPVDTAEQILQVVDFYRARWTIEEFFKAIKTGCAFEKRQIEDLHGLLNVLALCAPIAWQMLALRTEARREPDRLAAEVLTKTQLEVLRVFARKPLPDKPTVRDTLLAIAALGGHIRRNGEPGWQTLGRGYEQLLTLVQGWSAAKGRGKRSDES
jgi:hypothetical protein